MPCRHKIIMEQNWFDKLPVKIIGRNVRCFKEASSTNDLAWNEISLGAPEGTVIFAEKQSKGRGRFGREWYAPENSGIWASIILKPKLTLEKSSLLMIIGAIAVCELIRDNFKLNASIRWPNDVMINRKKIAGIIVETKYLRDSIESAVLGIGFNVNLKESEIPADLEAIMTSLAIETKHPVDMKHISQQFLVHLDKWHQKLLKANFVEIIDTWQKMSGVLNKKVLVEVETQTLEGIVIGLDPYDGIMLKTPDETLKLSPEKVTSLRLKEM